MGSRAGRRFRIGSLTDFFDALASRPSRFDTLTGERPDVWLYIHGPTHQWTTSLRREAARLLPAAEAFTDLCLFARRFVRRLSGESAGSSVDGQRFTSTTESAARTATLRTRSFTAKVLNRAADTGRA
jgi:hypothetical protein